MLSIIFLTLSILAFPVYAQETITLSDCIKIGLKNNPQIKKLEVDVLYSLESEKQVLAMYEPSLNIGLNRTHIESPDENSFMGTLSQKDIFSLSANKLIYKSGGYLGLSLNNTKDNTEYPSSLPFSFKEYNPSYESNMTLSYSQPLWKNSAGKNYKQSLKIIRLKKSIAEQSLNLQESALSNQIKNAYWDMALAQKILEIQQLSLQRAKKFLKSNKKKFADGLLEEVDIIATEAAITLNEASILLAEDIVENAKDALLNIINLNQGNEYTFSIEFSDDFSHDPINENQTINQALKNRPEFKTMAVSQKINLIDREIKNNEKLPGLDLTASYGLSGLGQSWGTGYEDLFSADSPTWYIGFHLNYFPFKKQAESAFKQSQYNYDKNSLDIEALKNAVITQCKAAVRRVNTTAKYLKAAKKAKSLQEKKLELEEAKFNQGRTSSQFVLNFQDDLSRAETEYFKAFTNYHKALADLQLTIGK